MINPNVKRAIIRFQRPIVIEQYPAGAWDAVSGKYQRGAAVIINAEAVVQEPDYKTLMMLEEAERAEVSLVIWTLTTINATDATTGTSGDLINVDGIRHKILKVMPRSHGEYYKAICGRVIA